MKKILFLLFLFVSVPAFSQSQFYIKGGVHTYQTLRGDYEKSFNEAGYSFVYVEEFIQFSPAAIDLQIYDPGTEDQGDVYHIRFQLRGPGTDGKFDELGIYKTTRSNFIAESIPAGEAGLDMPGSFCNNSFGTIDIRDVEYAMDNKLQKLAADFKFSCSGLKPFIVGKIRINTDIPLFDPKVEAVIEPFKYVAPGQSASLDGSQSYSDDSTITKFSWTQLTGEPLSITNQNSPIASVAIPNDIERSEFSIYEFQLEIEDALGKTDKSKTKIIVGQENNDFIVDVTQRGRNFWWSDKQYEDLDLTQITVSRRGRSGNDTINVGTSISFNAPDNNRLEIGNYSDAYIANFSKNHPSIDTTSCSFFTDSNPRDKMYFKIHDIEYSEFNGEIERFAADFDYCYPSNWNNLQGKIRFNTAAPLEVDYPIAHSAEILHGVAGEKVYLNGIASYSDKSDIQTYAWTQVSGEPLEIIGSDLAIANIIIPSDIADDKEYKFRLVVTDKNGVTASTNTELIAKAKVSAKTLYLQSSPSQEFVGLGVDELWLEGRDMRMNVGNNFVDFGERGEELISISGGGYNQFGIDLRLPYNDGVFVESGEYIDVYPTDDGSIDDPQLRDVIFSMSRGSRTCGPSLSDLLIHEISRDSNGEIVSLAIDFKQTCQVFSDSPTLSGQLRYNSVVPTEGDTSLSLTLPNIYTVGEGENVKLKPIVESDEPVFYVWEQIYGPQVLSEFHPFEDIKYYEELRFLAPTVPPGITGRLAFKLYAYTDSGRFAQAYTVIEIQDGDPSLDFFDFDYRYDKPAIRTDDNGEKYGIRGKDVDALPFSIESRTSNLLNTNVDGMFVNAQYSPLFNVETYIDDSNQLEIVSQWGVDENYSVIGKLSDGSWKVVGLATGDGFRIENDWEVVSVTHINDSLNTPLPEVTNDLIAGDGLFTYEFAIVKLGVNGNQKPSATNDAVSTNFQTSVSISLDTSSVIISSAPTSGTASVLASGQVSYAPNTGFSGTDTFQYTVKDNNGAESDPATVTVTVRAQSTGGGSNPPPASGGGGGGGSPSLYLLFLLLIYRVNQMRICKKY